MISIIGNNTELGLEEAVMYGVAQVHIRLMSESKLFCLRITK